MRNGCHCFLLLLSLVFVCASGGSQRSSFFANNVFVLCVTQLFFVFLCPEGLSVFLSVHFWELKLDVWVVWVVWERSFF